MFHLFPKVAVALSCCALLASTGNARTISQAGPGPAAFGAVALPVSVTPLDSQWQRTLRSGSSLLMPLVAAARGRGTKEQLETINSRVNRLVRFRGDWSSWGTADRWSGSAETLARGSGDCEDIAIVKMDALLALGVAPEDLYLTIGMLEGRGAHALLLVRVDGRLWVLDNLTDSVRSPAAYSDFMPMMTFSRSGRWVHAFAPGTRLPTGASRADTAVGGSALAAILAAQARGGR